MLTNYCFFSCLMILKTLQMSILGAEALVMPFSLIVIGSFSMHNGAYYLMMNLWRPTIMGWCLCAVMELQDGFTPEFLLIQQTIQKSESLSYHYLMLMIF